MLTSAVGTDLNIIGLTEMGDFRNGRSRYICIAKFDHLYFCSEIYHCWCDLLSHRRYSRFMALVLGHVYKFIQLCCARSDTAKESLK